MPDGDASRSLEASRRSVGALVVLLAAGLACGKRGDPLPPLRKNPMPPTALAIAQRGNLLQVSCAAPRLTLDGARLGIMGIELRRAEGEGDFRRLASLAVQMKAAPGETLVFDEAKPQPGTLVRFSVIALSEKHASAPAGPLGYSIREIPPAPLALVAELELAHVQLHWTEALASTLPTPLEDGAAESEQAIQTELETSEVAVPPSPRDDPRRPVTLEDRAKRKEIEMAARTEGDDGTAEQLAQQVKRERDRSGLPKAEADGASVEPTPEPTPRPTPPAVGVLIYRRDADEDYGPSLNEAPLPAPSFVDSSPPLDTQLCYTARTVASLQPFVESSDSEEACLLFKDIVPPEAIVGVTLLRQPGGIEVSWSSSLGADLAAYRLYRGHRGEPPSLLAELTPLTVSYLDVDPPPAAVLEYSVAAVDSSGNESEPSASARIRTQ